MSDDGCRVMDDGCRVYGCRVYGCRMSGIVVTVSFNCVQGLDNLWAAHQSDRLLPVLQQFFITPDVLDVIGASYIEIRSRMWVDEYEHCRKELAASFALLPKTTLADSDNDKEMIRLAKSSQPPLAAKLMSLRDDLTAFERHISEFTVIIKNHIPINMQHINTFTEFCTIMAELTKTKLAADMQPLRDYVRLREMLHEILVDIETGVCHPLAQVHAAFENERQQDAKRRLTARRTEMAAKLAADYDVSRMKHAEAQRRILNRDHGLFLGLVAVIYVGLDLAVELDQMFDEYLSGFQVKL
ncbi:hypothetical protein LSAT2_023131 [Lamellibrachia satsuma]|nr:hypothetical protein LSAT2_023131 [Lamellibrachia satsuma]